MIIYYKAKFETNDDNWLLNLPGGKFFVTSVNTN